MSILRTGKFCPHTDAFHHSVDPFRTFLDSQPPASFLLFNIQTPSSANTKDLHKRTYTRTLQHHQQLLSVYQHSGSFTRPSLPTLMNQRVHTTFKTTNTHNQSNQMSPEGHIYDLLVIHSFTPHSWTCKTTQGSGIEPSRRDDPYPHRHKTQSGALIYIIN